MKKSDKIALLKELQMDEPTFYAKFGGPMDLVQQHPELYMKYCMGGKMKKQTGGNLVPTSYINQFSDNVDVRQSDQRPSLSSYAPMYTSPEEDEQPVKVDKKRLRQEQRAERLEEKQKIKNSHISKYRNVRFLQTGGIPPEMQQAMMQQQAPAPQGGGGAEQAMQQIAQMLQQGMPPEQIIQQLVQSGVPEEQAVQMVQQVAQGMQGEAPQQGAPVMMQTGSSLTHNDSIVLNKYDAMNDEELQYLERMDNEELLKLLEKRSKINGQKMYTPEDENYLKKANKNDLSMMYGHGGRMKYQTAGAQPLNTLQEDNTSNAKYKLNDGYNLEQSPETTEDIAELNKPRKDNVTPILGGIKTGLDTVGKLSSLAGNSYSKTANTLTAQGVNTAEDMAKIASATKSAKTAGSIGKAAGTGVAVVGAGLGAYDTWVNSPDNSVGVKTVDTVGTAAQIAPSVLSSAAGVATVGSGYGALGAAGDMIWDAADSTKKQTRGGEKRSAWSEAGSEALEGAGTGATLGATIGSVVPVIGNVIGGVVGGIAGLIGGGIKGYVQQDEKNDAVDARNKQYDMQDWAYANSGLIEEANKTSSDFYRNYNKYGGRWKSQTGGPVQQPVQRWDQPKMTLLQTGGYDFKNTKFEPAPKVNLNLPAMQNRNYNTYGYGFDMGRQFPAVGAGFNANVGNRFNVGANVNTAPSYGVNVGYKFQAGGLPPEMMAAMQQGDPSMQQGAPQQAPPEPYKPGYRDISPSASIDSSLKPISYKGRTHKYGGIEVTDSSELEDGEYSVNLTDPQTGAPQRYIFSNATGFAAKAKKILKDYQSQYA